MERLALDLDNREISYLHAGGGPPVLLLHGTFWSRVWRPVIDRIAEENEVFAPDYPGFGRSGGRLEPEEAAVPELASVVLRFADALGIGEFAVVSGHGSSGSEEASGSQKTRTPSPAKAPATGTSTGTWRFPEPWITNSEVTDAGRRDGVVYGGEGNRSRSRPAPSSVVSTTRARALDFGILRSTP